MSGNWDSKACSQGMTFYLTGQIPSGKNQQKIRVHYDRRTKKNRFLRYANTRFLLWRERAVRELAGQGIQRYTFTVPLGVQVVYTPGDRRTRDIPGMLDALWYVLQWVGFVDDDKQFRAVIWTEGPVNKARAGVMMDFWKLPR